MAGTPADGGQADTPAAAMLIMDIRAHAMGEGGHGGSPNAKAGKRKAHQHWDGRAC